MSTSEKCPIGVRRAPRRTRSVCVRAAGLVALVLSLSAPVAAAAERSGVAFDADEGLAGRDLVTVLADYDSDGALSAQVFFASAPAGTPPTQLSVSFSPDPNLQACSGAGAALITTLVGPDGGAMLSHPALGTAPIAVQKSVEGDSISLFARDPRLAGLAFGCVQAQTTARAVGSPLIDALVPPLVLSERGATEPDTPLDLGGPGGDGPVGLAVDGSSGPPRARYAIVRGSLRALSGPGMVLSVQVNGPARVRAALRLGRRSARRLGVRSEIARGITVARDAGRVRIRLRARGTARSRIRRLRSLAATLAVRLEAPGAAPGSSFRRLRLR